MDAYLIDNQVKTVGPNPRKVLETQDCLQNYFVLIENVYVLVTVPVDAHA